MCPAPQRQNSFSDASKLHTNTYLVSVRNTLLSSTKREYSTESGHTRTFPRFLFLLFAVRCDNLYAVRHISEQKISFFNIFFSTFRSFVAWCRYRVTMLRICAWILFFSFYINFNWKLAFYSYCLPNLTKNLGLLESVKSKKKKHLRKTRE